MSNRLLWVFEYLKFKKSLIFFLIFFAELSSGSELIGPPKPGSDRPNDLRLKYLSHFVNYDLESRGFENSNSSEMGTGFLIDYKRQNLKGQFGLKVSAAESEFKNATGLSPLKSKVKLTQIIMDFQCHAGWKVGFEYRLRESDLTSPNQAFPQNEKFGIRPGFEGIQTLDESLRLEYEFGFLIPLSRYEKSPKTGSADYTFAADFELDLIYRVNSAVDASIGFKIMYETSRYSGDSDRASPSANETFIETHIPVGFSFRF